MSKEKITDKEAAERIKNAKPIEPFIVCHGTKFQVNDSEENGILVQISDPNNIDDSIAILIPPNEVKLFREWLLDYRRKLIRILYYKKMKNEKSKKDDGNGN